LSKIDPIPYLVAGNPAVVKQHANPTQGYVITSAIKWFVMPDLTRALQGIRHPESPWMLLAQVKTPAPVPFRVCVPLGVFVRMTAL
jgi:hypothetical protein